MKEYDLLHLIAQLKKLPDDLLIRLLKNACLELDKRSKKRRSVPARTWKKG